MSKNRLDETTIRRFMGLAGLEPIGESFFDRMQEQPEEEAPVDDALGDEMPPVEDDLPPAEPEAAPEESEAAAEMAQEVADAVADALTTALGKHGVTVDAGGGAAPEAEDALEPDAEAPADELPPEEELPLEAKTTDDSLTRLESSRIDLVDDEAMVQEVARRVAKRLLSATKKRKKR